MKQDHTFELVLAEEQLVLDEGERVVGDDGRRPSPRRLVAACAGLVMVLGIVCVFAEGRASTTRARTSAAPASVELAEAGKPNLNVMVMGHVDSGKSTLVGRMLANEGVFTADEIDKAKMDAHAAGKGGAGRQFAWLCDQGKEERDRGLTIHSNLLPPMETDNFKVTFIDVPGHRDFITEMKEASAVADVAILVVSAATGEFESSVARAGQAREHLLVAKSMGVKQLIVAVNKMDATNPPYERRMFVEIKREVSGLARAMGFTIMAVAFVPVSGLDDENLNYKSDNQGWFRGWRITNFRANKKANGKTLKEAIDAAFAISRDTASALRMPVNGGRAGERLFAYIQRGSVSVGATVQLCPSGTPASVDGLQVGGASVETASAGDLVMASLTTSADTTSGAVAYDESHECTKVNHFDTQMRIVGDRRKTGCSPEFFTQNYTASVDVGFQHVPSQWKLLQKTDETGKVLEEHPKHLVHGDTGKVRMYPNVDIDLDSSAHDAMVAADKGTWFDDSWELSNAVATVIGINAEGDDGPPKGDMIPRTPCTTACKCMDYFGQAADGVEGPQQPVTCDEEGNKLDDCDDWDCDDWVDCDNLDFYDGN